jgi:hypothetical protein
MRRQFILHFTLLQFLLGLLLEYGCTDLGTEPLGLNASRASLTLSTGDTVHVEISGGTPPYAISTLPEPSVALASITGSDLIVVGVGVGSTTVEVADAGPVQNTITIPVSVQSGISFSNQIQPIFENHSYGCTSCHGGNAGLFLTRGQSYANLVNVQAQAGSCVGRKRVQPGDASSSVLLLRVSGFSCGDRMPQGGNPISPTDVNLIRDWINQGAQNN